MKISIQNLKQEVTVFVFKEDELEIRDMSNLKSLLPLLAYQNSNYNVEIIFWHALKQTVCFRYKAIEIDTLM